MHRWLDGLALAVYLPRSIDVSGKPIMLCN